MFCENWFVGLVLTQVLDKYVELIPLLGIISLLLNIAAL